MRKSVYDSEDIICLRPNPRHLISDIAVDSLDSNDKRYTLHGSYQSL